LAAALATVLLVSGHDARADLPSLKTELGTLLDKAQFGAAVVRCNEALKTPDPDLELKALCAKAHVGLGDRLLAAGSPANARTRWEEAAALDPRLMDDADFVKRLTEAPTRPPPGSTGTAGSTSSPGGVRPIPRPVEKPPKKERPVPVPTAEDGPRFGLGFGMGLSFGFDGLASATLSWLTDQHVLLELALGIVYPSADVRFRWFGLKDCVTPYLGFGLFVPFGENDRLGLDLSSYESLYELGENFHLDLGLTWMPVVGLDLSAGVAFVTPFDQDHPDSVLFFPQVSGSATWRF
jgi:hypothetical protein